MRLQADWCRADEEGMCVTCASPRSVLLLARLGRLDGLLKNGTDPSLVSLYVLISYALFILSVLISFDRMQG